MVVYHDYTVTTQGGTPLKQNKLLASRPLEIYHAASRLNRNMKTINFFDRSTLSPKFVFITFEQVIQLNDTFLQAKRKGSCHVLGEKWLHY